MMSEPVGRMPGSWTDATGGRHTIDIPDPDAFDLWADDPELVVLEDDEEEYREMDLDEYWRENA